MMNVIQPTKKALRSLVFSIGALLRNGWRMLVWEDVSAGTIDLKGQPRSFRMLMRMGMWLTILLLMGIIFGDGWRVISPLQPLTFYNDQLAGLYFPAWIVPVIFGLMGIAWAYIMTGALHAPWYAKLLVLILFAMFDFNLILTPLSFFWSEIDLLMSGFTLAQVGLWNTMAVVVTLGGWLFLFVFFLIRWVRPERPGLEFPIMLVAMTALMFAAYFGVQLGNAGTQTQEAISGLQLTSALDQIDTFLNPFLALAGVEIILLGMGITKLVCTPLQKPERQHKNHWWAIGLGVFLVFRLAQDWILPLLIGGETYFSWGVVIIGVVMMPILLWGGRFQSQGELPGWVIPGTAVLLSVGVFAISLGYIGIGILAVIFVTIGDATSGQTIIDFLSGIFDALAEWNALLVAGFALMFGLFLAFRAFLKRQRLPPAASYTFLFFLWLVWWTMTRTGRPLESIYFRYEHITAVSTWFLIGFYGVALITRRLTPLTLLLLTGTALMFWLMNSRELLDDPFSPLFAWLGAQAALISFSIFLNVMNAGNRFDLNNDNPRWPRMTRGLLYFGYALLTVIDMLWLIVGHQADALATNQIFVNIGYGTIGIPLVLWAIMTRNEELFGKDAAD